MQYALSFTLGPSALAQLYHRLEWTSAIVALAAGPKCRLIAPDEPRRACIATRLSSTYTSTASGVARFQASLPICAQGTG